jgi:hypothetical protein
VSAPLGVRLITELPHTKTDSLPARRSKLRRLTVNSVIDGEVKELFDIPVHGCVAAVASVKLKVSLGSRSPGAGRLHLVLRWVGAGCSGRLEQPSGFNTLT